MSEYYERTEDLKNKINGFLGELTGKAEDYYSKLSQDELIEFKSALSDINNILTLKTTYSFVEWLSASLSLSGNKTQEIKKQIESIKPSTNGYDIKIPDLKIIAEIKSIVPVNRGNYYGAAQRDSILNDAIKLFKGKKQTPDTSKFIKFIGLLDLGEITDQAVDKILTPPKSIKTQNETRLEMHKVVRKLERVPDKFQLSDLSTKKVYLKQVRI